MYYKDDNEKPFDNNGFTFTDFLMSYGFDQLSWDTLPEEEKAQYRTEYDEMVSGAKETIDSEGGLYEAVKLNRARKRFQQINEYILDMNGGKNEADEQQPQTDNMQQPQQGDAPQQDMGQQGQMPPQQEQPMDNQQMPQDGGMEQGGDMGQMGDAQPDPTIGADADNQPMPDENGMMEPEMGGEMESDEVIDVDDLTQSQETTEYKLDGVDDKLNQLINIVGKFAQAIDDNEEKMEELKRELEERNPSQQERLNIRSMSGSPYTVSPQDYWSSQNARNPQYNVIADNDVAPNDEEELYTITDDDIKNFNKSEIEKSINDIPKNLKDYFNESYTYGNETEDFCVKCVECYDDNDDITFVAAVSEDGSDGAAVKHVKSVFPTYEIVDVTDVDGTVNTGDMSGALYDLYEEGAIELEDSIQSVEDLNW